MTDWMDLDIDEKGDVTIEKKNRNNMLSIQTAETCMELAVLLGVKVCQLCKTKDNNKEETEQLKICEQTLNELAALSGTKQLHHEGGIDSRIDGRKKKYVVLVFSCV